VRILVQDIRAVVKGEDRPRGWGAGASLVRARGLVGAAATALLGVAILAMGAQALADSGRRHRIQFTSANERFVLLNVHHSITRDPVFEDGRFVGIMNRTLEEDLWGLFDASSATLLNPDERRERLATARQPLYQLRGDFEDKTALISDDGAAVIVIDDYSPWKLSPEREVLTFFRTGKRLQAYTLGELLRSMDSVHPTISHYLWYFTDTLRLQEGVLALTTTECAALRFSTLTGEMLSSAEPDSSDRRCEGTGGEQR